MSDKEPARGEIALLRLLRQRLASGATGPLAVPFGDDMAGVPGAPDLLWTADALSDGVDFQSAAHSWQQIGRKAMAVNLSDCAAMGVRPVGALCAVVLQNRLSLVEAAALIGGAHDQGCRYGCPVVGGDTNSWEHPTVVTITVVARAEPDVAPVQRGGAREGDVIFVTGPCGGSILGRHMTFEPRLALGIEIARDLRPHAMIDISDGLVLDLSRILETSGCGAVLEKAALDHAIHADAFALAARDGQTPLDHALYDGEDFELIVVLPADTPREDCARRGLLRIGSITSADRGALWLEDSAGRRRPLPVRGWEHFL